MKDYHPVAAIASRDSEIHLTLWPHIESSGVHTERFDACLGAEIIITSRSGWHDPARALLALGYPPETLLHVKHAGRLFDPTIVPQTIGELAKWTYNDLKGGSGPKKALWKSTAEIAARARPNSPANRRAVAQGRDRGIGLVLDTIQRV